MNKENDTKDAMFNFHFCHFDPCSIVYISSVLHRTHCIYLLISTFSLLLLLYFFTKFIFLWSLPLTHFLDIYFGKFHLKKLDFTMATNGRLNVDQTLSSEDIAVKLNRHNFCTASSDDVEALLEHKHNFMDLKLDGEESVSENESETEELTNSDSEGETQFNPIEDFDSTSLGAGGPLAVLPLVQTTQQVPPKKCPCKCKLNNSKPCIDRYSWSLSPTMLRSMPSPFLTVPLSIGIPICGYYPPTAPKKRCMISTWRLPVRARRQRGSLYL
ncbi:hypothetical protein EGW08_000443 [Elysia chlorotica]|uniref:Uncharacterized protein n=1 Tax=Elysia chlorotica TaxID=188477 RepID=A0A3S1BY99_ELYCH|nr:hypothetical protein EGW08_000443 [Elysia chlorotica]